MATTILWALYALAKHPEVQERLHKEIVSVIGKDGYLTARDLVKIPYTKAFLKESIRCDCISFTNTRTLDQDIVLSGYNVPAGTLILSSIYTSSHSESYFKDPEEFKPERWLRETGDQFHPFTHLPFGFGPRSCIGKRFAELEIYLLLSKVVQKFRLEYNHEPVDKMVMLFLQPERKIKINFIETLSSHRA